MPKERTHWHLARRAAAHLPPGPLAGAAAGFRRHLLAGAVVHDTGYYALSDPQAQAAADRAHGAGGADSFDRFRALARHTTGPAALAFGFGALTHLVADAVFHPWVFSWTGDRDAEPGLRQGWLYRHQVVETALDLHLEALWGPAPALTFGALTQGIEPPVEPLADAFLGAPTGPWLAAHRRLQGLFHRRWARWAVRGASVGRRGGDGDWSGAFYGPPGRNPWFEGVLSWVNPVTGDEETATLDELVSRFDVLMATWGPVWETAWVRGEVPFAGLVGPALDTGVACDQPQDKRYFRPLADLLP